MPWQYSDPETVRQLLEANSQEIDHRAAQELYTVGKRLGELERAFLNDLDRVDRKIMTEAEYVKRQEVRREEQEILRSRKVDLETAVANQRDLKAQTEVLPIMVRTFFEDFQQMDVRLAKATLQGIIKAAHITNDGTVEIEFRGAELESV